VNTVGTDRSALFRDGSAARVALAANAIVFGSNLCLMTLELVAARLVARHLGASLYTWTSVIGVVLGGMSLGNYLGGWLADQLRPRRLLAWQCIASSAGSLTILWLHPLMGVELRPDNIPWPLWILGCVLATFFLPACLLGTIAPVAAKMVVETAERTGAAVGKVYAWGALGSIAGTLLTGFVFINLMGTQAVVCSIAGALSAAGVLLYLGEGAWGFATACTWLLVVATISVPACGRSAWARRAGLRIGVRDDKLDEVRYESNYYTIVVRDGDDPDTKVLVLDSLIHSYVPLDDPTRLEYDYERIYASITDGLVSTARPLSAMFIGGGGFVFPVYLEAVYDCERIDVAEIDPKVKWTAQHELTLPPDDETTIVTHLMDARNYVQDRLRQNDSANDPMLYDFIYGDAFNDFSVPYHLTTKEFNEGVNRLLKPGGVYMINIIDIYREGLGGFLGAYVATALETFPNVYVYSSSPEGPTDSRDTFVIACSKVPLDLEAQGASDGFFEPSGAPFAWAEGAGRGGEMETVLRRARGITLTDDYVPVDNLLAPVFRER
jgi:spermidine synthase